MPFTSAQYISTTQTAPSTRAVSPLSIPRSPATHAPRYSSASRYYPRYFVQQSVPYPTPPAAELNPLRTDKQTKPLTPHPLVCSTTLQTACVALNALAPPHRYLTLQSYKHRHLPLLPRAVLLLLIPSFVPLCSDQQSALLGARCYCSAPLKRFRSSSLCARVCASANTQSRPQLPFISVTSHILDSSSVPSFQSTCPPPCIRHLRQSSVLKKKKTFVLPWRDEPEPSTDTIRMCNSANSRYRPPVVVARMLYVTKRRGLTPRCTYQTTQQSPPMMSSQTIFVPFLVLACLCAL